MPRRSEFDTWRISQRRRVAISLLQTGRTPEQSESQHAANVEALRAAMKLGAELQDRYDAIAPGAKQGKRDRFAFTLQIQSARANLNSAALPLDPLTFPSQAALKKQADAVAAWTRLIEELSGRLEDARRREANVIDCVKLQAAIVQQRFVIANLETLCEGGRVGYPEGGLSTLPTSSVLRRCRRDRVSVAPCWSGAV